MGTWNYLDNPVIEQSKQLLLLNQVVPPSVGKESTLGKQFVVKT